MSGFLQDLVFLFIESIRLCPKFVPQFLSLLQLGFHLFFFMRDFTRLAVQPCHDFFHIVKRRAFFQLAGTRKDKGRHTKSLANAEGIAVPRNADDKVVGRCQCLFVKLYECIFDAARLVSEFFHFTEMGRNDSGYSLHLQILRNGLCKRGPFDRVCA